jgi:ubiquinone/menaquinone biosynthesis C-methylase UbiE
MSQATLQAHYKPNWNLSQAMGFTGYNCGYAARRGAQPFAENQKSLVWRLLEDVPIHSSATVLDIGCGIGGPTGWIFERFAPRTIIGLEYCQPSVVAAGQRWADRSPRPWFLQGDAHHLPLASASVDVIFNLESALHYSDKRAFLAECRRVLKPGGTLCLGDITAPRKYLFAAVKLLNRVPTQFNSNIRLWSLNDYQSEFARAGFSIARHEDASNPVADSLADGLEEIRRRGWRAMRGFRARVVYLAVLERLIRSRRLTYELFAAVNR